MNRASNAIGVALWMASSVALAKEPPVEVNVEGLPSHVRARVLAKAAEGYRALVHYLNHSYTVHGLRPQFVIVQRGSQAMYEESRKRR